ncbi:MAG: Rv0909 family putative TA system antitoxin [Arthrobacter sp.]|uniref:Rv0909 family putative TA system antitoxin n=1 Tax=unclassified Arthrobacter TaxID=235627 RepID=UPI00264A9197|nr:antitoxin [Micrococcaceae bacterium]MDN5811867.1 antitoxin [Micrococcaceae bacterium]MDN5823629.1 antitoxin [Micrococcaceae bacterium]MDN5878026.1 antitoxin [Micrococcaceae bacterium]MDN5885462.1 antitoxin [Micrococcaceae bacterium]
MGLGDSLGGLGDKAKDLKNEHGDKINEGVDAAQDKFGDQLGDHKDAIDGAQEKFLGGDDDKDKKDK